MLFDDFERTDDSPARQIESNFAFLNRTAYPDWARVREMLEEWFAAYPRAGAGDVRGRFRNPSPGSHYGAWWELYVYTLLRLLGFAVEVHPPVEGTARRPDFRATRADTEFFVEAVTTFSGIVDERRDPGREAWIADAINTIQSRDFFVHLDFEKTGLVRPSNREISRAVESWLSNLDPDVVIAAYGAEKLLPELTVAVRDWRVKLQAWPKSKEGRRKPPGRLLGAGPGTSGVVNDVERIRANVDEKRKSFGMLPAPLMVAALAMSATADEETIMEVLFGNEAVTFQPDRPDSVRATRLLNGLWTRPRRGNGPVVAAVIVGVSIVPWTVADSQPSLWIHPAHDSFCDLAFPFSRYAVHDGEFVAESAAAQPWEVFGLWRGWPMPEPVG